MCARGPPSATRSVYTALVSTSAHGDTGDDAHEHRVDLGVRVEQCIIERAKRLHRQLVHVRRLVVRIHAVRVDTRVVYTEAPRVLGVRFVGMHRRGAQKRVGARRSIFGGLVRQPAPR